MKNGINVRLNTDLTKYHSTLIVGMKGVTCDPKTEWGRSFATGVKFENGVFLEVLPRSLDILDEGYLEELAKEKQAELDELKNATDIELTLGPRGGFLSLSYKIGNSYNCIGSGFRKTAEEYFNVFKEAGLEIKESIKR